MAWRPATVFFDIDGTLSDSAPGLTRGFAYALEKCGWGRHDPDSLLDMVGPPLLDTFMAKFGMDESQAMEAILAQRVYYRERGMYENRLYPGIGELLSDLAAAGVRLAVATSKPDMFANAVLSHFGLLERFEYVGAVPREKSVSKSVVLAGGLAAMKADPAASLMVGDRRQDIDAAAACGVPSVGVLWGYGSEGELAGARFLAADAGQLRQIILGELP